MQPRRFALIGHTHNLSDLVGDSDDISEGTTNLFFTNERAEDAIGAILTDTASVDFVYTDNGASPGTIQANVLPEFVQDTVGAMLTDSATVDFTYTDGGVGLGTFTAATIPAGILAQLLTVDGAGSLLDADFLDGLSSAAFALSADSIIAGAGLTGGGTLAASRTLDVGAGTGITVNANDIQIATAYQGANPTATIGLSAVNGSATTTMRSDGAPALSQAIIPTWTETHTWTDSDKVVLGTGSDLSIYHDGTDSFLSNATGKLELKNVANAALELYTNNTLRWTVAAAGNLSAPTGAGTTDRILAVGLGAVATPSLAFADDLNTGLYTDSADSITITSGGVAALTLRNSDIIVGSGAGISIRAGDATTPNIRFFGDTNTGIYSSGADAIDFTTGGVQAGQVDAAHHLRWIDGTITAPAYSFLNSSNTGMYSIGGGILSFAANYSGLVGADFYSVGAAQAVWRWYNQSVYCSIDYYSTLTRWLDESSNELARFDTSHIYFPTAGTTASAANTFLNSGSSPANELLRSTSSIRYKRDIRDLPGTSVIDQLRPVLYKSRCKVDDKSKDHLGFIAEEVATFAPELVHFNADKTPESVQYDRIVVPLVAYVKQLEARIKTLEAR